MKAKKGVINWPVMLFWIFLISGIIYLFKEVNTRYVWIGIVLIVGSLIYYIVMKKISEVEE